MSGINCVYLEKIKPPCLWNYFINVQSQISKKDMNSLTNDLLPDKVIILTGF